MRYLTAVEAEPRLLTVGAHLPQGHPEHPRVRSVGKRACLQALWGTPDARINTR